MFEHALDYIHQQKEAMNATSLARNQQPLASLLSPAALDHLEDLSGCRARVSGVGDHDESRVVTQESLVKNVKNGTYPNL